jgi:predicted transcriptional regulator
MRETKQIVTPNEIAENLGVSPKKFRAFLRKKRDAGQLSDCQEAPHKRWKIPIEYVKELCEEFKYF